MSGPTHPGLNVVDDEQRSPVATELGYRLQVRSRKGEHSTFGLDGLEHHRRHGVIDGGIEGIEITRPATWLNPGGNGSKIACLAGWPVAASVASVRPWKESRSDITR